MIISESQIMQLINIAKNYSSLLRLRKNDLSGLLAENINTLVEEIAEQQSTELRDFK